MSILERRNFIKERFGALGGKVIFTKIINATKDEVEEEKKLAKVHDDNNSIEDDELRGFTSQLQFDAPKFRRESDAEILLSKREKFQIKLDLDDFRWHNEKCKNQWIVKV